MGYAGVFQAVTVYQAGCISLNKGEQQGWLLLGSDTCCRTAYLFWQHSGQYSGWYVIALSEVPASRTAGRRRVPFTSSTLGERQFAAQPLRRMVGSSWGHFLGPSHSLI